MKKIAVILAGGSGTRFWPVSTSSKPKQFQHISGGDTLLNETIDRINKVVPMDQIYIVAGNHHQVLLYETLPSKFNMNNLLLEPMAKNTAGAVAAVTNYIDNIYKDPVIGIFPADHYIRDKEDFVKTISRAYEVSYETCKTVLMGIKVTYPATGYGYIDTEGQEPKKIKAFKEKPDYETAKEYMKKSNYFWNSGILISKTSVVLKDIMKHMPELYFYSRQVTNWHQEYRSGALEELYNNFVSESIDYGVLEHCSRLLMLDLDVGWSDLGSWDALPEILDPDLDGNIADKKQVLIDTKNTLVMSDKKFVATIGLEDLIIVETEKSLLICKKGHSQDIKLLVASLKEQGRYDLI